MVTGTPDAEDVPVEVRGIALVALLDAVAGIVPDERLADVRAELDTGTVFEQVWYDRDIFEQTVATIQRSADVDTRALGARLADELLDRSAEDTVPFMTVPSRLRHAEGLFRRGSRDLVDVTEGPGDRATIRHDLPDPTRWCPLLRGIVDGLTGRSQDADGGGEIEVRAKKCRGQGDLECRLHVAWSGNGDRGEEA